jgi:hypothetical protein
MTTRLARRRSCALPRHVLWMASGLVLGCAAATTSTTPMLSEQQRLDYFHQRARVISGELAQLGFPIRVADVTLTLGRHERDLENFLEFGIYSASDSLFPTLSTFRRLLGHEFGRDESSLSRGSLYGELASTAAYYDPIGQSVVFRRSRMNAQLPDVDFLVAHELSHVYQDQAQGGLDAFSTIHSGSLDESRAAHSVVEGQASLIARALLFGRRGIDVRELDPSLEDETLGQLLVGEGGGIMYTAGQYFLLDRYRKGGWPAVLAAYREPPTSTEQLLHPEKYGVDLPTVVTLPPWPDPVDRVRLLASEVLGEMMLFGSLSECLTTDDDVSFAGRDRARMASIGWDGDRFNAYQLEDDQRAALWRSVWDDDASAEEFTTRLREALKANEAPEEQLSIERRDNVIDVAFSEDPELLPKLRRALHDHPRHFRKDPADAVSSRAARAALTARQAERPRISGAHWVHPRAGIELPVLPDWKLALRAGGQVLVGEESKDTLQLVAVQRMQDLLGGDLKVLLQQLEGYTRALPYPIASTRGTIRRIAGVDTAVLEVHVGEKYPFRMRIWAIPRERYYFLISGVVSDGEPGQTDALLAQLEQGIVVKAEPKR